MEAGPHLKKGPGELARRRGAAGEEAAAAYLTRLGYSILARNFKTRFGEVDIVARDGSTTVFVEVKRRENQGHGRAAEFVDRAKMRRVVSAAGVFAARHGLSEHPTRFDVIAIDAGPENEQLRHHKSAFDAR